MRLYLSLLLLSLFPLAASASGKEDFAALKQCVMNSDLAQCHGVLTPESHTLFDRFYGYKLMPCLPTDFTYYGEKQSGNWTIVQAAQQTNGQRAGLLKLAFEGGKLDLAESLRIGLGEKWQEKLQFGEQLFLFIRANAGGNFRCDQVTNLIKK